MSDDGRGESDLAARIQRARGELEPKRGPNFGAKYNALSAAWRMVLELVVGTCIGLAIGFGLDELFTTKPIFLIVMGLFGFAAGVKTVLLTAKELSSAQDDAAERDERDK